MARVYLLGGREYLKNQSLNQFINQSASDSRGTGVFKLLTVEELQKKKTQRKNHAVMKSVLLNAAGRFFCHHHLRLLSRVCSANAKTSSSKHPAPESFVRYSSTWALGRAGRVWNGVQAFAEIRALLGSWLRRWTDDTNGPLDEREEGAGLSTEVNSIPRLAHSLNHDRSTWIEWSGCPEGLKTFWESWKSNYLSGPTSWGARAKRERRGKSRGLNDEAREQSSWWRGVYFSSGGQAAVVKAFLCWTH